MANSLQITAILNNTTISLSRSVNQLAVTTTGDDWYYTQATIDTSEVTLTLPTGTNADPDLSTPGYCFIRNMDATNFVEIRTNNNVTAAPALYDIKLLAGEVCLLPFDETVSALDFLADTAACQVEIYIMER